jgi:hypothetical protein
VTAVETRTDARCALLERLIDHAPLFPPASMSMEEALAEDARVRARPSGWMVARFVCPASRLSELGEAAPLRLSVVLDSPSFAAESRVEAREIPPDGAVPPEGSPHEIYVELAPGGDIAALRRRGLRAKVRCGGARVPPIDELAAFVRACRDEGVSFKATAGLHHALRTDDEHGILNLLAAAVFGDEEEALAEREPAAFRLEATAFAWRDHSASAEEVARVRKEIFVSIGSCSAQEPVDELRALGML